MPLADDQLWAVVPIKNLDCVKTRLAQVLTPNERRRLVLAMLEDVLTALQASAAVDCTLVVSPEDSIGIRARAFGAVHMRDEWNVGHSTAVQHACARAVDEGAKGVIHVPGDVPLITAQQIARLCEGLRRGPALFLGPDRSGTGTNVIAMAPIVPFEFRFGPGSFLFHFNESSRHGMSPSVVRWSELELDLDTPESMGLLRDYLEHSGRRLLTGAFLEQLPLDDRSWRAAAPGGRPYSTPAVDVVQDSPITDSVCGRSL